MKRKLLLLGLLCSLFLSACGSTTTNKPISMEDIKEPLATESVVESETQVETQVESVDVETTVAGKLENLFNTEIANENVDVEQLTSVLSTCDCLSEISIQNMEVTEGYLTGFNEEITGFTKGHMFAPMVGTIPFVGYVFETEDVDSLVASLNAKATLNWNICTEADELKIVTNGNLVLCVMSPYTFE